MAYMSFLEGEAWGLDLEASLVGVETVSLFEVSSELVPVILNQINYMFKENY